MVQFSHSLAVVIGINQYGNGISLLQSAVNDAREIARILKQEHQYDEVILLLDEQASSQALQQLLEHDLPRQVQSNDRLLFYFAGHGIALNGEDGPEGFLIPQDARLGDTKSYLPMSKLQLALSELPCRHFLGILDCCFAGAFRWSSTRKLVPIEQGIVHKERFDRFIADPAWQVITSAAYDQTALDALTLDTERGQVGNHSPFAAALIAALSAGKADLYPPADTQRHQPAGDGVTTATDLYIYLRDQIEPATEGVQQRQTPGIWPLKKHDKGEYIFLTPGHTLNLPPAPPLDESKNPYRGLQSFEAEQSDLFFGRQALTVKLCEFVSSRPLTVVLGASGSGKSSLVKAGLIPELNQQNEQMAQPQWQILAPMRPGESPFKALDNTLQDAMQAVVLPDTASNAERLTKGLAVWTPQHPGMKLLLVIDQFEELITLCRNETERQQFLDGLAQAAAAFPDQLRLVLTLRSDFEPQFQDTVLKQSWNTARFVVPPMTRAELREAIEEPATKRVMYFQSDDSKYPLVDQLVDEVAEMPGALPLLSFTLSELYLKYLRRQKIARDQGESIDRAITEADYKELGGVVRSLTQRADQEYEAAQQEGIDENTIRNVMLRMVAVSGGELTRRRVQKSELLYPEPKNAQVQKLIQRFSTARLLVEGLDTENQEYVEPAHDQLVIGWGKIKTWLTERQAKPDTKHRDSVGLTARFAKLTLPWQFKGTGRPTRSEVEQPLKVNLPLQREVTTAANHWNLKKMTDGNRPASGFLWDDDPRLPQLEQTQQSADNWFNQTEAQFVEGSITQRRRNIQRFWFFVFLAFAGVSTFAAFIWVQLQRADLREQSARVENLLQSDPVSGLLLAVQATGQYRSTPLLGELPEVNSALLSAVQTARERKRFPLPAPTNGITFTPDGQTLALAGRDGNAYLLNLQGQLQQTLQGTLQGFGQSQGGFKALDTVKFQPNGTIAVTKIFEGQQSAGERAQEWNINDPSTPVNTLDITDFAFSPDGNWFISGREDGTVSIQSMQNNSSRTFQTGQGLVSPIILSRDGQTIVTQSDATNIGIWTLEGKLKQPLIQLGNQLSLLDFSATTNQLLVQDSNRGYSVLACPLEDLSSRENCSLLGNRGTFAAVYAPDEQTILSYGEDGSLQLWSAMNDGQAVSAPLLGHTAPTISANFSPDGKTIVSVSDDNTLRFWDVEDSNLLGVESGNAEGDITAVSPNGQEIAVEQDGTTIIRNTDGQEIDRFSAQELGEEFLKGMAIQSGGQRIAIVNDKGEIRLREGQTLSPPFSSPDAPNGFSQVQFSPDGRYLISTNGLQRGEPQEESTCLWRVEASTLTQLGCEKIASTYAVFSPDSKVAAIGGRDGTLRLWNVSDGNSRQTARGHQGAITAIAVSSNGNFATGDQNSTIRLYTPQGTAIGSPFYSPALITRLAFAPDGKTITGADQSSIASPVTYRWSTDPQHWLQVACQRLSQHQIFQTEAAQPAKATCEKYVGALPNVQPSPSL